jgi:2-oxoisovalerate dehydrogenase E1 component
MVALALRTSDPALLHYRSGVLCRRADGATVNASPGRAAGADGPCGRADCRWPAPWARPSRPAVIADLHGRLSSPRAVGLAIAPTGHTGSRWTARATGRRSGLLVRRRLGQPLHRAGAINTACHRRSAALPVPILFVCEGIGFGISVPTPRVGSRRYWVGPAGAVVV